MSYNLPSLTSMSRKTSPVPTLLDNSVIKVNYNIQFGHNLYLIFKYDTINV